MSDRTTARSTASIIGIVVALIFLVAAASFVVKGCQEPDNIDNVVSPS